MYTTRCENGDIFGGGGDDDYDYDRDGSLNEG